MPTAISAAGGDPLLVIEYLRGLAMEDRLVRVGDVIDSSGTGSPTNVQSLAARRLRSGGWWLGRRATPPAGT